MKTLYADKVPNNIKDRPAQEVPHQTFKTTICDNCERATRGHCPWAQEGKPIKGWTAEKTVIHNAGLRASIESYMVIDCPGYVPTWIPIKLVRPGKKTKHLFVRKCVNHPDTWSEDGVTNLLAAMMKSAREDYILIPRDRKQIAEWVRGLKFLDNPEEILSDWKGLARIYDLHPEKKQQLLSGLSDEAWEKQEAKKAHEKLRAYWIVYNSGESDMFAECEHCGREIEIRRAFPRRCPGCDVIMRGPIKVEDYDKLYENALPHGASSEIALGCGKKNR